jgi:hypothetical protein
MGSIGQRAAIPGQVIRLEADGRITCQCLPLRLGDVTFTFRIVDEECASHDPPSGRRCHGRK